MRRIAVAACAAATALPLLPAAAEGQSFRNCPTGSTSKVQGLTAGGGVTCATARTTARRAGNRNPRGTITVNRFRCKIVNRTSSGRGWSCTRAGGRKFISWVYVT